jgi:hypothetical protein
MLTLVRIKTHINLKPLNASAACICCRGAGVSPAIVVIISPPGRGLRGGGKAFQHPITLIYFLIFIFSVKEF